MSKQIPDIFLSPHQLIERARKARNKAGKIEGMSRHRPPKRAAQDEAMAAMKRLVGDAENEAPAR